MRSIYLNKNNYLSLDQGSIISGCVATGYENCEVSGCIITARCDLAHEGKVAVVHYLPIVSFLDWYRVFGKAALFKMWDADKRNQINTVFKNGKKGADVMNLGLSYDELKTLALTIANKTNQGAALKGIEEYFLHQEETYKKEIVNNHAAVNYLKSLIKSDNHEYYYIEDWIANDSGVGKVILLKDIKSISFPYAAKLPKGIAEVDEPRDVLMRNSFAVSSQRDNLYMIENQIASPFIEHIVQAFSYGFNRVGIEDIEKDEHFKRVLNTIQ
jgi:hypothetical protein